MGMKAAYNVKPLFPGSRMRSNNLFSSLMDFTVTDKYLAIATLKANGFQL